MRGQECKLGSQWKSYDDEDEKIYTASVPYTQYVPLTLVTIPLYIFKRKLPSLFHTEYHKNMSRLSKDICTSTWKNL